MSEVSNNPQVNNIQALASSIQKAVTENKGQLGSHTVVVIGKEQIPLSTALSRMTELQKGLSKGDRSEVETTLHNTFVMISQAKNETKDIANKMDVARSRSGSQISEGTGSQISSGEVSEAGSIEELAGAKSELNSDKLTNLTKEIHETEKQFSKRVDYSTKFLQLVATHYENKGEAIPKELTDTLKAYQNLRPHVDEILELSSKNSEIIIEHYSSPSFEGYMNHFATIVENDSAIKTIINTFEKTDGTKTIVDKFKEDNQVKETVQSFLSGAFQRGPRHKMFLEGLEKEVVKLDKDHPQIGELKSAQTKVDSQIKDADSRLVLKEKGTEVRDALEKLDSSPTNAKILLEQGKLEVVVPRSTSRLSKMATNLRLTRVETKKDLPENIADKELKGFENAFRTALEVRFVMPELLGQVESHYEKQLSNIDYKRVMTQAHQDYQTYQD